MRKLKSTLTKVQVGDGENTRRPDKARSSTGSAATGVVHCHATARATAASAARKRRTHPTQAPCGLPPFIALSSHAVVHKGHADLKCQTSECSCGRSRTVLTSRDAWWWACQWHRRRCGRWRTH